MQREREVGFGKLAIKPRGEQRARAGADLLGRLPDEHERARPVVAQRGERARGADETRHVDVVSARLHGGDFATGEVFHAGGACVGQSGLFLHGQAVEIGADEDGGTGAVFQHRHDTETAAEFFRDLEARGAELARDDA